MILLLLSFLSVGYLVYFYWRVSKYPKGPFPLPIFGNALSLDTHKLNLDLDRLSEKYGEVFTIWMMNRPWVILNGEKSIREALLTRDTVNDRNDFFPANVFQTMRNGGVANASGENWREQRRTALHILRDFGFGKNIMEQKVQEQMENFIEAIRKSGKTEMDPRWHIQVAVANIINQLLYGFSYPHDDCDRLMKYVTSLTSCMEDVLRSKLAAVASVFPAIQYVPIIGYKALGSIHGRFNLCVDHVKADIKTVSKNYDTDEEPTCFVHAYLQRMESNPFLTKDQLTNVCSDFFLAGMETTTTTLRWGVLHLAHNQEAQDKLRAEVIRVVGFSRLPSLRDKNQMPYATAAMTEVQRCANILPLNIFHRTSEETEVMGMRIPGETTVIPQIHAVLADPKIFPEPDRFRPERFLNSDGSLNSELINRVIPFGIGKRQCAGESLARIELFLGLTSFVQKFKFFPPKNGNVDLSPVHGIVRFPSNNLIRVEEVNEKEFRG